MAGFDTKKHKEQTLVMLIILLGSNGNSEILYSQQSRQAYNIHVHTNILNVEVTPQRGS
jgi:hypothetical protein